MPKLGILITTCDADAKHHGRILGEFTRLGYPFAVNFDHCSRETKQRFMSHPLYLGGYQDDDPSHYFDERDRQRGLDILVKAGFDWASYLDSDEVFDRRAPEIIPRVLESKADVVWCPVLDFWGDDRHYRVDGPFGPCMEADGCHAGQHKQLREKFFNLRTGRWTYLHPDVHHPIFTATDGSNRAPRRLRCPLYVLHYGIMDRADVKLHTERWNTIYTRKLGKNPHPGFYAYINDPATVPELREFDYETFDGD